MKGERRKEFIVTETKVLSTSLWFKP
uniref:Uncharacterized protein n=1 Tax=Rhizophora mucronata TaxID=61149 RepID=A0A2P2LCZ1_RHIMU